MKPTGRKLEKLWAQCPRHGRVRVVCPRCAGKIGGKAKRGRGHRQRLKALSALADELVLIRQSDQG
jgi:hypothetical protein